MHYVCYVCDNDMCQTHFAVDSLTDTGDPTCPNCGCAVTDTGEVIINPRIVGRYTAEMEGHI